MTGRERLGGDPRITGEMDDANHLDLGTDLHGRTLEYVSDIDRRWFAEHPGKDSYERPPVNHELCDPVAAAAGRCVPLIPTRPDGTRIVVIVTQVAPGARTRVFVERTARGSA